MTKRIFGLVDEIVFAIQNNLKVYNIPPIFYLYMLYFNEYSKLA